MSNWMGTGYGGIEDAWKKLGEGKGPRRVWLPPEKTVKLMFLDDDPSTFWEHQFSYNGDFKNWEPCVTRNKIGPECPICKVFVDDEDDPKEKRYAYFVGLHTVINMTPWFTKKGQQEVNFVREVYASKLGSDKKPGVLKKLKKLKEKHGRLRGLIINVERPGKQTESCGSEFDVIEKIDPSDIVAYSQKQLSEYLARVNEGLPADKQMTMAKQLQRNPWEPYNFEKMIAPRPIDELRQMFARRGAAKGVEDGEDRGGGGGGGDDDMPY